MKKDPEQSLPGQGYKSQHTPDQQSMKGEKYDRINSFAVLEILCLFKQEYCLHDFFHGAFPRAFRKGADAKMNK